MSYPDSDTPMLARGAPGKHDSKAELRGLVPRRLLDIYDAVSLAQGGRDRIDLVIEVLQGKADEWVRQASLIQNITRGNPSLPESDGRRSE